MEGVAASGVAFAYPPNRRCCESEQSQSEAARRFVKFLLSPETQKILKEGDYGRLRPRRGTFNGDCEGRLLAISLGESFRRASIRTVLTRWPSSATGPGNEQRNRDGPPQDQ